MLDWPILVLKEVCRIVQNRHRHPTKAINIGVIRSMNYTRFSPSKQLSELVQCFWALESNPHETTPGEYFLMADGCLEIIFQYSGGFKQYSKQSARIRFQHSTYNKFVVEKELGFFGVRLYPHVANQLFGMPANEVSNIVFDFPTLFKQKGRDLSD